VQHSEARRHQTDRRRSRWQLPKAPVSSRHRHVLDGVGRLTASRAPCFGYEVSMGRPDSRPSRFFC